MTLCCLP